MDKKVNVKAAAISLGLWWGGGMLVAGWVSMLTGWGLGFVDIMSSFYIGFAPTFLGGIIGGIWGFIDGFIGGAVLAFLYNFFAAEKKQE